MSDRIYKLDPDFRDQSRSEVIILLEENVNAL